MIKSELLHKLLKKYLSEEEGKSVEILELNIDIQKVVVVEYIYQDRKGNNHLKQLPIGNIVK